MSDEEMAAMFPLLDLPLEIIEQVVSHLHSSALVKLGMCSHAFKEMTNSSWYWRNRIQNEKEKIICVDANIDDWKRIFFSVVEFVTVHQVVDHAKQSWRQSKTDRYNIIFSPGTYILQKRLRLRPNINLCGLWDTPWSQKPTNQKTVFISHDDAILFYDFRGNPPDYQIGLQNISFITKKKDERGHICCILQDANFKVQNCEFSAELRSGLLIENSDAIVNNCRFHDSKFGLYTTENSVVQVQGSGKKHYRQQSFNMIRSLYISSTIMNITKLKYGSVFERNDLGFRVSECHMDESTIVDSTFAEHRIGILIRKSIVPLSILRCVIERSTDRAIDVRNNCECSVIESKISNNLYGLEVLENTTVTIYKNIITNNMNSGVRIRHDVNIQRIAENEIKNNGLIGISMAEYSKDKRFTREELLANNKICDNKTDLVLLPKKPKYEMLYRDGDDEETLSINCRTCIARNMCTYAGTEANHVVQEWYRCYTCGLADHGGVCIICLKKCHEGHDVSFAPTSSRFYCDCGSGSNCKAMKVIENAS